MTEETKDIIASQDRFVGEIRTIIDNARATAVRSVDFCRVQMYWNIGKRIFEEEQHGKERADYGAYLIKSLAKELEPQYGSGFGQRQLERARQFYRLYPIASTVRSQLNRSQYRLLIQIQAPDKREYYELEPVNNAWTARDTELPTIQEKLAVKGSPRATFETTEDRLTFLIHIPVHAGCDNKPTTEATTEATTVSTTERDGKTTETTTETTTERGGKTTEKIIRLMRENPQITNKELAAACGITEDGVYWNTKKLRKNNIIRRVGGDFGGHWEVIDN